MTDDAPIVADLNDEATVQRVNAEAHRMVHDLINPALAALETPLQAPVMLTAAIAGVMSVADRSQTPAVALMGAINVLVKHAQALGWFPPMPPGQQVVLVMPPAEPDPLAGADMGRPH